MILNVGDRVFGIVVDAVSDVVALHGGQVRPTPELGGLVDTAFIVGLGTLQQGDRQRMLILLDIERLMRSADMGLIRPLAH